MGGGRAGGGGAGADWTRCERCRERAVPGRRGRCAGPLSRVRAPSASSGVTSALPGPPQPSPGSPPPCPGSLQSCPASSPPRVSPPPRRLSPPLCPVPSGGAAAIAAGLQRGAGRGRSPPSGWAELARPGRGASRRDSGRGWAIHAWRRGVPGRPDSGEAAPCDVTSARRRLDCRWSIRTAVGAASAWCDTGEAEGWAGGQQCCR